MSEPRKINKYLLDDELLQQLENSVNPNDVRLKADLISFDDLNPDIRSAIQGGTVNPSIGYNDTELRNRIVALEADHISKDNVFDKTTDHISESLLDPTLQNVVSQVADNAAAIMSLQASSVNGSDYRLVADKIGPADLADDVMQKINSAYAYYQSVIPDGNVAEVTDAGAIMTMINSINLNKADRTELADYRLNSIKISMSDLEDSIVNTINQVSPLQDAIANKVNADVLNDYRLKSDVIVEADLEAALASKINSAYSFTSSTQDAIDQAVEEGVNTSIQKIKSEVTGDYYYTRTAEGTPQDTNMISMKYRRQMLAMKSEAADSTPGNDAYSLSTMLYWVLRDGVGDKYKQFPAELQRAICEYHNIPEDTAHNGRLDPTDTTESSWGISYAQFSLTDAFLYLVNRVQELESRVAALEN